MSNSVSKGKLEYAKRRALNIFDKWVDDTGFVARDTGYYYELASMIESGVEIGVQEALGDVKKLEEETL